MFTEVRGDLTIPNDLLVNTPSRKDGISEDIEMKHRFFCCNLIKEGGILLKLYHFKLMKCKCFINYI